MKFDPIQPRFLDYANDINETTLESGIKVRSVRNETNGLFSLYYLFWLNILLILKCKSK